MPEQQDPDDLIRSDPELWRELVESAPTFLDWLIEHTRSQHDLGTPRGRSRFIDDLLPTIRSIGHAVVREEYLRQIAVLGRVDPQSLLARYSPASAAPRRSSGADEPVRPAARRPRDRRESFVLQLTLKFDSVRRSFEFDAIDLIEDSEDRAILTARLNSSEDEWSDDLPDSESRIAELRRDSEGLPPYSDAEAVEAVADAIARIRKTRSREGLRLKNLEIGEQERQHGADQLARAATQLANDELCDPELTEAASSLVEVRDSARRLHQPTLSGSD